MVEDDKKPQIIDTHIVSLPQDYIEGIVNILEVLPDAFRSSYAETEAVTITTDCNDTEKRRCMMERDGGYTDLIVVK